MPDSNSEELVERIAREVMRALGGSAAGAAAESRKAQAPGGSLEPFILAPDTLRFVDRVVEERRTIENGYVPIGVSARHCHVSREDLETLFGPGAKLTEFKPLLQPGEFAAEQAVAVVGPRMRSIEKVRILGPVRRKTQVELALTDLVYLGLEAPVRPSGSLDGTPGIVLVGPAGCLRLRQGVIRANRHIHLNADDARRIGVKDNELVLVRISGDRPVIYHDVQARVSEKFVTEMHLDTDDANAVGVKSGDYAQIIRGYHECRVCETCH